MGRSTGEHNSFERGAQRYELNVVKEEGKEEPDQVELERLQSDLATRYAKELAVHLGMFSGDRPSVLSRGRINAEFKRVEDAAVPYWVMEPIGSGATKNARRFFLQT